MQLFLFQEVQLIPSYWTWLIFLLFLCIPRVHLCTWKFLVKLLDLAKFEKIFFVRKYFECRTICLTNCSDILQFIACFF